VNKKYYIITTIAFLLFVPFLGSVHLLDWDEANFAELAREMIVSGNFMQPQMNFLPFYEKPPLFIWLQVLSMKVFGINEFAARFPNALTGIMVLCTLFYIGKKHFSERMAWLWVMCFGASIAPHFYFKTGLIDPLFNYFIFLSIYFFGYLFLKNDLKINLKYTVLSALFTALAVMTKGPVAIILIVGSLGFGWILLKFKNLKNLGWVLPWGIITIALSSLWFIYETRLHGDTYMNEFITYQIRLFQTEDAKHGGTILFHPIALILGCFPTSIFMWSAFKKSTEIKTEFQEILFKLMLSCGIVVLVVFSLVQTKIIHYSSMDYYPITFFAAYGLNQLIASKNRLAKFQISALILIGFIWGLALTITPYLGQNIEQIKPYIHDANFLEQLKTPIEWNLWACGFGVLFYIVYFTGIYFSSKNELQKGLAFIFIACLICIETVSLYYLPRIESLVQGSMVEFCKGLKSKDVNTQSLYLKSYNQYFYSDRQPYINKENGKKHLYYLYDEIEKDCYTILRTIDSTKLDTALGPNMTKLYDKNGFVFYHRTKD
jgi:hypothetical protein